MFRTVHVLLKIPTKIQTFVRAMLVGSAVRPQKHALQVRMVQLNFVFMNLRKQREKTRVRENSSTKAVLVTIAPVLILRERE